MRGLSVVIPFSGSDSFNHTLASICRQTLDSRLFDVTIVVEHKRRLDSRQLVSLPIVCKLLHFKRPIEFTGHSAGIMRNIGAGPHSVT
jgi:hypothetical protein